MTAGVCAAALLGTGLMFLAQRGLRFSTDAQLVLCRQEDGSLVLSWPEVEQADGYQVRAVSGGETILEDKVHGPGCTLPAPAGDSLTVSVRPVLAARRGPARTWTAKNLTETVWPEITGFEASVEDKGTGIRFHWAGRGGEVFLLYQVEGDQAWPVAQTAETGYRLPVGDGGEITLPFYDETLQFAAGYGVRDGDVLLCGALSQPAAFQRSDFLGSEIQLRAVEEGDNVYTFTWNEAKGDRYLLQHCSEDVAEWTDLCEIDNAAERSCKVRLPSGTQERVRVIGVDENQEPLSQSNVLEITTELSTLYATVWPVENLDIYQDPQRKEVVGTAEAATAFCVLGETGGLFRVGTPDGYGYIDSKYCLINLPDYMGELCAYDVANSYASLFAVHGYEIPTVTGTVIAGYENIRTEEGQYLVPLLYPTAQKLADAARQARQDGYRLKIYDAYRPGRASAEVYQAAMDHLYDPVPDAACNDVPAAVPADPAPAEDAAPAQEPEQYLTYNLLMTNGEYHLGSFLAANGSTHNLGIALDLTLERLDTREELEMQTAIHDLSHYAVVENNNANADRLAEYMQAAGFGPLSTEWWHFQDDDTRTTLSLTDYLQKGVTPEGWHLDLNGWYYCRSDGSRIRDEMLELDGQSWKFDADGYVVDSRS